MKQAILKFPKDKAKEIAQWFAENSIVTNLSFMMTDGESFFGGTVICAIVCFPDDKATLFDAKFQSYIKTKV